MVTAIVWDNSKCFSEYIKLAASHRDSPDHHQWELTFINSMPALHVIGPLRETGGLKHTTNPVLPPALVTMERINRRGVSPN